MARSRETEFGTAPISRQVSVGIDQSYSGFGLSVVSIDDPGSQQTWVYSAQGTGTPRLAEIRGWLQEKLREVNAGYTVAGVAMEGYAFGAQRGHQAGELGGMVRLSLYDSGLTRSLVVPPTTLKKYVTGQGTKVTKSQMMLHVYKKWGVELNNDNAADAYGLGRLAGGHFDLAYEKEIVDRVHTDLKYRD